jgi:hypothetical protein
MALSNTFLQTLVLARHGLSTRSIATRVGVSPATINRNLALAGFRPRDCVPAAASSKRSPGDSLVHILTMAKGGYPRGDIVRITGHGSTYISLALTKGGFSRESLYLCRVDRMREANCDRPWSTRCIVPLAGARP